MRPNAYCPAGRAQTGLLETLEPRLLLTIAYPSNDEQYLLELINRARANPTAEAALDAIDLNEGVPSSLTLTADAKQPLAMNPIIVSAAEGHSIWMIENDTFSHVGPGTKDPAQRMIDAGYVFSDPAWSGENIAWRGTYPAFPDEATYTAVLHQDLFVDTGYPNREHRVNLLAAQYKEVGTGIFSGDFTSDGQVYHSVMVTEDFGASGSGVFLTGVAFDDSKVLSDDFYTPGEGLGGITISATRQSDNAFFSTTTWSSGGYSLALPAGVYDVQASGAGLGVTMTYSNVLVSDRNVKLDFDPAQTTGIISGSKWNDLNANGVWDAGELPLSGSTVYLDLNHNGKLDSGEPSMLTSADGSYEFTGLQPGTYYVSDVLPTNWTRSTPTQGYYQVNLSGGQTAAGRNFGELYVNRPQKATVLLGTTVIADGRAAAVPVGNAVKGAVGPTLTFTIRNDGDKDLVLTTPFASLPNFDVGQPGQTTLHGGQSTQFTVTLRSDQVGSFSEQLSFLSNDPAQGTYFFPVSGTVEGPITSADTITIGDAHAASASFRDADNTLVTVTHKIGTSALTFSGDNLYWRAQGKGSLVTGTNIQITEIDLAGTTDKSSLTVTTDKTGDGLTTIGEITGSSPMGTLTAKTVDLVGKGLALTGGGYIAKVQLHDLTGGADIVMPGTAAPKGIAIALDLAQAGSDLTLGSYLASLTAVQWLGSSITVPWANTITVSGNSRLAVPVPGNFATNLTLTGHDSKNYALGKLTVAGTITGTDITAAGGAISSLTAGGWNGGSLTALWLDNLTLKKTATLGGDFAADLTLTDHNSRAYALGKVAIAGTVNGANFTADAGKISSVSAGEWFGGTVSALALDSLATPASKTLTGDFTADLTLGQAGQSGTALGKVKLAGQLSGTWTITGAAGSVAAGTTNNWTLACIGGGLGGMTVGAAANATLDLDGALGSLKAKSWSGDITAASLGSLNVTGDAKLLIDGNFDGTIALGTGDVGTVTIAHNWSGIWTCNSIRGATVKGDVDGLTLTLLQGVDPRKQALGSLKVTGWIKNNSTIAGSGNFGTVAAGGVAASQILAGDPTTVPPVTAGDFGNGATIQTLTISGIKDAGLYVDSFLDSLVVARYLGSVTIKYATATLADQASLYADSITSLSVTTSAGTTKVPAPIASGVYGNVDVHVL